MNRKLLQQLFCVIFCNVCIVTFAQMSNDTTTLSGIFTYEQCVEYALRHNIQLKQSVLTRKSSEFDLEQAKAQWFPSLNFSSTQSYANYPHPGENARGNSYSGSYGLNAGWALLDGGSRKNAIKRAELQMQVNDYTVAANENDLRIGILQQYLQIMYAKESIEIAEKNLDVSKTEMERAEQLMNAGKLSRVDYVQLQSQYNNDLYNLTAAKTNLASQKSAMKQYLELDITQDIDLAEVILSEEMVLQPLPDKVEVYNKALSWMPSLKGTKLQQDISDYDIKIAKSGILPKVNVNASVATNHATGMGQSFGDQLLNGLHENIGLTLSVPIFDQKSTKTQVAKAKVDKLNAELSEYQERQNISREIESCYLDAVNAQAKYVSGKLTLASAELTDELTNEQFCLGKVNTLDLLSSHAALANARQELLQLKYMAILNLKMLDYYGNNSITLP